MIEFNSGVCSCLVEFVIKFKFFVNWMCGGFLVIIGEIWLINVDCEFWFYV